MNPQLPNTLLDAHPVAIYNMQFYSAEGISFTPVKPMKLWKISYEGPMRYLINFSSATSTLISLKLTEGPNKTCRRKIRGGFYIELPTFSF